MIKDTKACSKCGIEKFLDEFHKRPDRKIGVHPQCKECRKKYSQSDEGLAVAEDRETYNSLDSKGQGVIDQLATTLMFNLRKKVAADPLNVNGQPKTLNMGTDSARHLIFAIIRLRQKIESK